MITAILICKDKQNKKKKEKKKKKKRKKQAKKQEGHDGPVSLTWVVVESKAIFL